jgi:cell division protein ZapA (FtsZ GTPase activity inhibitor)
MMSDTSVTITIAGINLQLKVSAADHDVVQQASSFINEHISEFEKNYPVKEKRDVLAMVSLQMVTELLKSKQQQASEVQRLQTLLDELNSMVENHAKKVQL